MKADGSAPTRARTWDQPADLTFDFGSVTPSERTPRLEWGGAAEKGGVKEAIIRWLEEQL